MSYASYPSPRERVVFITGGGSDTPTAVLALITGQNCVIDGGRT